MRPVNLFLTEDGVLKLGYYGLATQSECFPVKGFNWDVIRLLAPEVFRRECKKKSDVWSFGISLIEMMGITPYVESENDDLPIMYDDNLRLPFDKRSIKSSELIDFLEKCFRKYDISSASKLLNVSVMG